MSFSKKTVNKVFVGTEAAPQNRVSVPWSSINIPGTPIPWRSASSQMADLLTCSSSRKRYAGHTSSTTDAPPDFWVAS